MGFMDKVKAQATQVATKAQEAGKAGQEKLQTVQAKKKVDALLRDLGAAVYAGRTDDVERLKAEVRAMEEAGTPVETAPTADAIDESAATAEEGGDYKLDDL